MKPTRVEVINDILAIVWDDGHESYYDFEPLRRHCPCAVCKGESNVLTEARPMPQHYTPASFAMKRWEYVGGYGLQPHWADGHGSGIYSFAYLRQLCTCDQCAAVQQEKAS